MKPPRDMSAKEYARYLHEECFFTLDVACQMANWSPEDDYKRQTRAFITAMICIALVIVVLAAAPGGW